MRSLILLALAWPAGAAPLVYLSFDGAAGPASGAVTYEPGRSGLAARLDGPLALPTAGRFEPDCGTVAAWVCLRGDGAAEATRYLFSLYGHESLPEAYRKNRFSAYFEGGELRFAVWGDAGQTAEIRASVADWRADEWHHLAITWRHATAADRGADLRIVVDGRLAAEGTTPPLRIGRVGERLVIGGDADASARWLDGLLDELFIDRVAHDDATIAAAAAAPGETRAVSPATPAGGPRPHWWHDGWPFRVAATLPAGDAPRDNLTVELPTSFAEHAAAMLGQAAELDVHACRVVADGGAVLPSAVADGRLRWRVPGTIAAGAEARFSVYFRLLAFDWSQPLVARRAPGLAPAAEPVTVSDYATEAHGAPWEFARDVAGIDNFGDQPEYIRVETADGAMRLTVRQDPYFIWGTMWGTARPKRPVDIDLGRYRVLEIRCRQSVSSAEWSTYGRVFGRDDLLHHDFLVRGTGWQTVRVDLRREARWRGRLSAFRIDPTNAVDAVVDIAWVRLLAVDEAVAGEVRAVGDATAPPASLALDVGADEIVGSRSEATVTVLGADGQPVVGQPVTIELRPGSSGRLSAADGYPSDGPTDQRRRGLTAADGTLRVGYQASPRAGAAADRLVAVADFTEVAAERVIDTRPGPPARLNVSPARVVMLPRGQTRADVTVQVADSFGNPLAVAGRRVRLTGPDGTSLDPAAGVTGPDGSLSARLSFDPARRWVARVGAEAGELRGESAALCYTPDRRDWGVTVGDNGYFRTPDGRGWLPLGGFYANWVGDVPTTGEPGRRLTSFVDTTDAEKIAWLRFLADCGVTSLRFMLRARRPGGMEPMDIGGRVNPELYAEALHYLDLARPFGIRFLLVLHEDYDKPMYVNAHHREAFCLPRWSDDDLDALPAFQRRFVRDGRLVETAADRYTDADAIACQDLYTRELIGLLRDNPQVFAYELENEQVAVPPAWVNHQVEVIRSVDPRTPICMSHGGGGLRTADPLYWLRQTSLDFYTYHLYPGDTVPDETDYGLATNVLARYGRMVGRCFLGESVGDEWSAGAPEAMRRRVARDIIWFSLCEGNPGCMFWNARGWEVEEFRAARRITDGIDFGAWRPREAAALLGIPHPVDDDLWFRTPAGGEAIRRVSRQTEAGLRLGAEFDYTVADVPPVELTPGPIQPSPGFEASTLANEDRSQGVTYLRNVAGTEVWTTEDTARRRQLVRTVAPAALTLRLRLGPGERRLTVVDLVTGQTTERRADGEGTVDLGVTEHDLAVRW